MTSNSILWVTTIIMLAGGLLILATGKRRTRAEGLHTVLHGVVPIIAACSYLAMATGQGLVSLPTVGGAILAGETAPTRIFYFARYIDWTFTTPVAAAVAGLDRHAARSQAPRRHRRGRAGGRDDDHHRLRLRRLAGWPGPSGLGSSCPARRSLASTTSSGCRRWRPTPPSATTSRRPTSATPPSCPWCG